MSMLDLSLEPGSGNRYRAFGFRHNPFPQQGKVESIYVPRPELRELEKSLRHFLNGQSSAVGMVWALEGSSGYGKSNFLRAVEKALEQRGDPLTASRFLSTASLSPRMVAEQVVQSIGETRIADLVSRHPEVPEPLRATDFGRVWENAGNVPPDRVARFLVTWLGGQQTYKADRAKLDVTSRERLPPAVSLPYLRAMMGMLDEHDVLKRIVILVDEFEDVARLKTSDLNEYMFVLKTLLNTFNWRGLYVVLAGQKDAFNTISELYPSIATRWTRIALQPIETTERAVEYARAYMHAARDESVRPERDFEPFVREVAGDLFAQREPVSPRDLFRKLHERLEALL